ncbi:MAG: hypothetical protein D6703_02940 [Zetaproteobacteria bacterium]|nr:MAG: hypothetical protein D6703_02940 [Zetaproteobacteria bacterium]
MELRPEQLLRSQAAVAYLYGDDRDGIMDLAESLLDAGEHQGTYLRVDCDELDSVQVRLRTGALFGPSSCRVLVRNAEQADPPQSRQLLSLVGEVVWPSRMIICAPDISWKKSLHKRLKSDERVVSCCLRSPGEADFHRWLSAAAKKNGVSMSPEAMSYAVERLCGMRQAAKQFLERARCYLGQGADECLDLEVVSALLGEKAPDELEGWCAAVASRKPEAIGLAARLMREQGIAPVQMTAWLGGRMQRMLLARWYQAQKHRDPVRAAGIFGAMRKSLARDLKNWPASEIIRALELIAEAERNVKGGGWRDGVEEIERLTLELVRRS